MINKLAEALGGEAEGVSSSNGRVDRSKWVGKQAADRDWVHPDALMMQIGLSMD